MTIYATNIKFLDDVKIEVTYQDGKIIRYDMSLMFDKYPKLKELRKNRTLFESGHLDPVGFGVIWNDELDFDLMSVYESGKQVGTTDISLNQRIGIMLIKAREEKNITQAELAKLSHIDQGDISKIERGLGNPTVAKISKLFEALGFSLGISIFEKSS